jgi:hypothetical protein
MSLPGGYTQLKYIRSSGTQYINTRFKPSGKALRVVMKFRYIAAYSSLSLFGNHTSTPYSLTVYGARPTFWVGNSSDVSCGPQTEQGVDYTLDVTAENGTITAYWNGVKYTATYSGDLYTEQPIFIFGGNSNGALAEAGNGYQLEMWQLYDGGALVRDYVPAKSSAGAVGLYDNVEGVFETNAGNGAFAEGPLASGPVEGTGVSLIGGVSFGINDGKCLVDGTAYSIKKGRTLIGGTGYDVSFAVEPIPVTIAGNVDASYCYAEIAGTKYDGTTTGIEVFPGDVIVFGVYGSRSSSSTGRVTVDGTIVFDTGYSSRALKTYAWTVPVGLTSIAIGLSGSAAAPSTDRRYGRITVTTT